MKKLLQILLVSCVVLCANGAAWAVPLTPEQMYLGPNSIPPAVYDYPYCDAGYVAEYQNVEQLQVLPALEDDGQTYLYNPPVDYEGDITGTDGSITFHHTGPYFVKVTYVGDAEEYFSFGVEFMLRNGENTYKWKEEDTPAPDVVITDPALAESDPDFPPGTDVQHGLQTWEQVIAYMKTLTNAHVELGGHGSSGSFSWAGKKVLHNGNLDKVLKELRGHVNNLTFMSCSTGADPNFIQGVADILGESGGYDEPVGGDGTKWYINDDGKKVVRKRLISETDSELPVNVACIGPGGLGVVVTGSGWDPGIDIEITVTDMSVMETTTDYNGNFIYLFEQHVYSDQLYIVEAKEKGEPPETAESFQFSAVEEKTPLEGIKGDLDNDGDVDLHDFRGFANNWLAGVETY